MAKSAKPPGKRQGRKPRGPAKALTEAVKGKAPDPGALTPAEAARILRVPPETIAKHLEAGAPAGPEGRINLVHYAAWLVQQLARDRSPPL